MLELSFRVLRLMYELLGTKGFPIMSLKRHWIITLLGGLLLLATACSLADAGDSNALDGTSWVLFAYRKTKPIPGTRITIEFEQKKFRGSAGCNSYSGGYQIQGDTITVSETAVTLMACMEPDGVMEQERYYLEFLQDAQRFEFDGERLLIFRTDGEALTFQPSE